VTLTPTLRQALAQSGLVPIDAQVLLAHVLERDRAWIAAHATDALTRDQAEKFFALAKRRREGEPVAYLVGRREFHELPLGVNADVLIPRPETETLVEVALARLPAGRDARVLDLGTGSGAIALALARERPQARILATDISDAALVVARDNADRLALANVSFLRSDWYGSLDLPEYRSAFDLIVSNPPYIARADPHLAEGDLRFEPAVALSPGEDGLVALRAIIEGAGALLVRGGWLVVEHGHDQAEQTRALFETGGFAALASARDLAGTSRVALGRRP
jgi:release factor glutamine methyltransferase